MKEKGFFGIGCLHMKNEENYGTLFRSAQILGASFIFLIGAKFKRQSSDTNKSWRSMPLFEYKDFADFNAHRPFDCPLVGIELLPDAIPLAQFSHPPQACYLLGSEEHGLTKEALQACQQIIYLPGESSLNVAAAGSIVLYDRVVKMG